MRVHLFTCNILFYFDLGKTSKLQKDDAKDPIAIILPNHATPDPSKVGTPAKQQSEFKNLIKFDILIPFIHFRIALSLRSLPRLQLCLRDRWILLFIVGN